MTAAQTSPRFDGQVAVITGGASGIGAALARRLHAEGAHVLLADMNESLGEALAQELGERAVFRRTNVAVYAEVEALIEQAIATHGRLDMLFNNAGIGNLSRIESLSLEDWQRVLDVDLSGVFYGIKAALPHMRAKGRGAIVNTASISGMAGDFGFAAYNAAKAGVINLTRTAAIDNATFGIRVNAVCPGPVATPILGVAQKDPALQAKWSQAVPMKRFAQPEEIASVLAFLASDDASYLTGAAIPVDGGATAHTGQPNLLAEFGR